MKKVLLGILSFILLVGTISAQKKDPSLKTAKKAYETYNAKPSENVTELKTAVENIEKAIQNEELKANPATWLVRGEIYNAIASEIIKIKELNIGNEADLPQVTNPPYIAMESYKMVEGLEPKKFQQKAALTGLQTSQGNLSQFGIFAYEAQDFEQAYNSFSSAIAIHEILKKAGETSSLDADDNLQYQEYLCGLSALNGEMNDKAAMHFEKLYKEGYDKPAIYEALYKLNADKDIDAAYKYLETGREKHADDVSLLFAEINHFLKVGKLEELISKLKSALEKEPNNLSIYSTLGNVYDQLYQKEYKEKNMEKADELFQEAKKYYSEAVKIDPKYFEGIYSIGALHYNKAAFIAQELNELGKDMSKAGMKKYDEKRLELLKEFDKALPYFQDAEKENPNDLNTLIALKEIYAKKDDFDTSNEFKSRLEKVQAGEKVDGSFFNK